VQISGSVNTIRARTQGASEALSFLPGRGSVGHIADNTHLRVHCCITQTASVRRSFPRLNTPCAGVGVISFAGSRLDTRAVSHEVVSLSPAVSPGQGRGHVPTEADPAGPFLLPGARVRLSQGAGRRQRPPACLRQRPPARPRQSPAQRRGAWVRRSPVPIDTLAREASPQASPQTVYAGVSLMLSTVGGRV
jgi:hypothetical protein